MPSIDPRAASTPCQCTADNPGPAQSDPTIAPTNATDPLVGTLAKYMTSRVMMPPAIPAPSSAAPRCG